MQINNSTLCGKTQISACRAHYLYSLEAESVCVCVCVMYCYSRLKSGNCATTPLHCHHVKRACVFFSSVAKVALDVFGRPVFINKRYWLREDSVTV